MVPSARGEGLCLACGMCCDGTLFLHTLLEPDEVEPARRLGLTVIQGEESRVAQPCLHHRGGACAVYAERPGTCARFRCAALERCEGGEESLAAGLDHVRQARALVAAIRGRIPGADGRRPLQAEIREHFARLGEVCETAAWRRENRALLLDVQSLEILLQRYFRGGAGASGRR